MTAPTCEACRRAGGRVELRQVSDGSSLWLCVNPIDCQRHWPLTDKPRGVR